jgi:hypothetical protein
MQVVSVLTSGVDCRVEGSVLGVGVRSGLRIMVLGRSSRFSVKLEVFLLQWGGLFCDGIDRGRRSKVDPMRSDTMRRSDGVRRAPSRQYSSARRQVLLLLRTRSCANDNKHSRKEVGGRTT